MKRLIVSLLTSFVLLSSLAGPIMAEDVETCVQVTQYGGGVGIVCGAKHQTVDTGLADINPLVLASFFFILAGVTFSQYKKIVRSEIGI